MDSNAATRLLPKLRLQEVQPIINNLVRGGSSIIKRPILLVEEGEISSSALFLRNQNKDGSNIVVNEYCIGDVNSDVEAYQNLYSLFPHQGGIIGGLTYSHNGGHSILLQFL